MSTNGGESPNDGLTRAERWAQNARRTTESEFKAMTEAKTELIPRKKPRWPWVLAVVAVIAVVVAVL